MESCEYPWGSCSFPLARKGVGEGWRGSEGKESGFQEAISCLCKAVCVVSSKTLWMITTCTAFAFLGLPL